MTEKAETWIDQFTAHWDQYKIAMAHARACWEAYEREGTREAFSAYRDAFNAADAPLNAMGSMLETLEQESKP